MRGMSGQALSFGMIGASSIGIEALLEPVARSDGLHVHRIAARRTGAARPYADAWGVQHVSTDYGDVLTDADVDAVYISNAAADHAHWAIAALHQGKHVLCEKPIGVNGVEARAIADAAEHAGRIVMEGFHYRFHPLFSALHHLVSTERFGRLTSIRSVVNGKREYDPASILHVAALGGGSLLHNGVYAVHWSRLLFNSEPVAVSARQRLNPSGADSETMAELRFTDGRTAGLHCSFDRSDPVSITLGFRDATVVVIGPIAPHHGHSIRIIPAEGPSRVSTVAGRTSFDYQLKEFVRRVRGERMHQTRYLQPNRRGDDIAANYRCDRRRSSSPQSPKRH